MAGGVQVGGIESFMRVRDEFTATLDKLDKRLTQVEQSLSRTSKKTQDESAKAKAAYDKLAASLDPVVARSQKYEKSVQTLDAAQKRGIITQAQYNSQLNKLESSLRTTEHWTSRLGHSIGTELTGQFTRWFAVSTAVTGIAATFFSVARQMKDALIESEAVQRKVEIAVRRAGDASELTADQILSLADKYSRLTGIDDELIAGAIATATRFNRLGTEILPRVTQAALDMSAATGDDLSAALEKVARMTNQPLRALTLLNREGYAVSASTDQMIKSFLRAGDIESAQVEVLKILESQYGGTAAAARDTMGGALNALSVAWENLLEKLGEDRTGPLRDGIEKLITLIETLTSRLEGLSIGWYEADIAITNFQLSLAKMQLGAAQGPIARLLNPVGAEQSAKKTQKSIDELEQSLIDAGNALANIYLKKLGLLPEEHRKGTAAALEQTTAETKLGEELKKITSILNSASEAVISYHESLSDTLDTLSRHLKDQNSFADALNQSEVAYSLAVQSAERANAVEAETTKLTRQHRQEIDKLNDARNKLISLGYADAAAKVAQQIETENKAFQNQIKIIGAVQGRIFDLKKANEETLKTIRENREHSDELALALAGLEDASAGVNSSYIKVSAAIEAESIMLDHNIDKSNDLAKTIEKETLARLKRIDSIRKQTEAMKSLTSLRQEAAFSVEVVKVGEVFSGQSRDVEIKFLEILRDMGEGSIEEGRKVFNELVAQGKTSFDQIKQYLKEVQDAEFVIQIREDLKTPIQKYREYIQLVEESSLIAIEKERVLADARSEFIGSAISDWASFASTLDSLFGGLFSKIASALSSIEGAFQAGNQLGGMLQKYAGAGSWASSLGMYAAAFTAFYEFTKMLDAHEMRQRGRRWTSGFEASAQMQDGTLTFGGGGGPGESVSKQLQSVLDGILDAIGGFLAALPDLEIQIRNDGKKLKVLVAGELVGIFSSAEEAVNAAVQAALSQSTFLGVGEEILHVLELAGQTLNMTLEELQHNLDVARQTQQIRIGQVGSEYVEMINGFLRLIEAQKRLGLEIDNTIDAMNREIEATKARVLGIDMSTSEQLAAIRSLNQGIAESSSAAQAAVQREIDITLARIATLENAMASGVTSGGGSGSGGGGGGNDGRGGYTKDIRSDWERELADLRQVLAQYTDELGKIPAALSDFEISMGIFDALYRYLEGSQKYEEQRVKYAKFKVEMEFLAIKQQLVLLGRWEEFQQMFNDAYNAALTAAGKPVRRGGGGGQRQEVRDFISDREYELSVSKLSAWRQSLADLNRTYDEQIAQAGKDQALREKLLTLKAQEIALLEQEEKARLDKSYREFLGLVTPFDKVRETASNLIKEIEDSPFGNARKARMIGKVLADLDRQIERMSNEAALSLFGQMLTDLEKYGADESLMLEVRKNMAIIEHTLKMANYAAEIAILKAQGKLSADVLAAIDKAFDFLQTVDPLSLFGGAGSGSDPSKPTKEDIATILAGRREEQLSSAADRVKKAMDLLSKYLDQADNPLVSSIRQIASDFAEIEKALGKTPQILNAKTLAIQKALEDFLQPIQDAQRDLFLGEESILDAQAKFNLAQSRLFDVQARFRSGDLSIVEDVPEIVQDYLKFLRDVSPRGSRAFSTGFVDVNKFFNEVLSLRVNGVGMSNVLGSAGNPMTISGLSDLSAIGEAQIDRLDILIDSSNSVAVAVRDLKTTQTGLAAVA